jgi:uncharacterized MAPEG superfamily protein
MKTELLYLTWVTVLTGLLWVPYILERAAAWGLRDAVGYPDNPKAQAPWARRLMKAHVNAVENLVVFATLVLAAQAAGVSNGLTADASIAYFWARVIHVVAYTFALPWVRTLAFVAGFIAQAIVAWVLLGALM